MGHAIYYCAGCSCQLRDPDFEKGAAFRASGRVFCKACAPEDIRNKPPEAERKMEGLSSSSRAIKIIQPDPVGKTPTWLYVAAGVASMVGLLGAIAFLTTGSSRHPAPAVSRSEEPTPAPAPTPAPTFAPAPTLAPTPPPAPKDPRPAEDALRKARDFAQSHPKDLVGQIALFDAAVLAAENTGHHATAVRERDAVVNLLMPEVKSGLDTLEAAVRQASNKDEFGAGLKLFEEARSKPLGPEWLAEIDRRSQKFEAGVQNAFSGAKTNAVAARQRGDEAAVKRVTDRIEKWRIERYRVELANALAATTVKPKPPPPPPVVPKGVEAYRARWAEVLGVARSRDAAATLKKLDEAKLGVADPAVQAEAAADLESLRLAIAVEEEGLQALARSPKGQKLTLFYLAEAGTPVEVSGTLTRVDNQEILLAREKGSTRIPVGEVAARSLAQLAKAKRDGKGLALLCLFERDLEGAKGFVEGDGGIPDKYWAYAGAKETNLAEAEARKMFWTAERELGVPAKAVSAAQKFAALLRDRAETPFVKRNSVLLAARAEPVREFFYLFEDLHASGPFRGFKGEKDEPYWKSLIEIDPAKFGESYVEVTFSALADTEYRCWFTIGGCCTESVTCSFQVAEGSDPPGETVTPVRNLPSMQHKTHESHVGRGRPTPRFGWVAVPLPKFTTAGPKRVRLVTTARGFCVSQALVSATRPGAPTTAETKELERTRIELRGSVRPDPTLVGHWKFSDRSGLVAADSSASGLEGRLVKGATWGPGTPAQGSPPYLKLDGTGYVDLGNQLTIIQGVHGITLSAWMCPDKLSDQMNCVISLSKNTGTTPTTDSRAAMMLQGSGFVLIGARSNDGPASMSAKTTEKVIKPAVWVHVAGVIDYPTGTITVYVNGAVQTTTLTGKLAEKLAPNTPSTVGAIGADDDGSKNFFNGRLADVRIYSRALTKEEIIELAVPLVAPAPH